MNKKQFYRQCYLQTGGWIPVTSPNQQIELGDFCQIKVEQLRCLGNILSLRLVEDVLISENLSLDSDNWRLNEGVSQIFCATEQQQNSEWTNQVLEFEHQGSFFFYGGNPTCQLILNFSHFKDDITVKLTQSEFNFRDIYVITGVTTVDDWALAIAGKAKAQLKTTTQIRASDYFDLLIHQSSMAEQSNDIAIYQKHNEMPTSFFKAKKLVLKDHKKEYFLKEILCREQTMAPQTLSSWLNSDLLDRVEANELNLGTCLDFFTWVDVSLDDVEKLC